MKKKYLLRLDDACPTMDRDKWKRIEEILDRYGIKPMVGVIPHNEDSKQIIDPEDDDFWVRVSLWKKKGWVIALHGYNHCYTSQEGLSGLNPLWKDSEFSGVPLDEQCKKIRYGIAVLRSHGINPLYFFAPSHTFDNNTLLALKSESDIRIISDTIATGPYRYGDFVFIPQFSGQCREIRLKGLFTFCLHPSVMNDKSIIKLEEFLRLHKSEFTCFDKVDLTGVGGKKLCDRLLSFVYFTLRKMKRLS